MARAFKPVAVAAARAADDKKAEEILVLDVRRSSPVVDYLVLATAASRPHLEAVERKVEEALDGLGLKVLHRARPRSDQWRVLDYGGMMVHVMSGDARRLYALERLHDGAGEVAWRPATRAKAAAR
ncbi:MAG: ribosome silencing factor [Elusimicrobia bacterium]|nr:ribosome silencing factor [Elusimicrobiota bacterium]